MEPAEIIVNIKRSTEILEILDTDYKITIFTMFIEISQASNFDMELVMDSF